MKKVSPSQSHKSVTRVPFRSLELPDHGDDLVPIPFCATLYSSCQTSHYDVLLALCYVGHLCCVCEGSAILSTENGLGLDQPHLRVIKPRITWDLPPARR